MLEPENDHILDSKDNDSEVETKENNLESDSIKTTVAPVNELQRAPSHWNKLRNLVLVDESIPQTPIPPQLLNNNNNNNNSEDVVICLRA